MASESTLFEDANKDFLTCSICKEIFKHPKQLKCMHNFCQDCLHPLVKKGTPCKIKCPLCREEVELKVKTASEIEDNIFLSNLCEVFVVAHLNTVEFLCSFCSEALDQENASRCIDCSDNLCDKCAKAHTLTRLTRNHKVILMSELETETLLKKAREGNVKTPCQKHPNNQLEYFCQTCQVPICLGCTVVDHKSRNGHELLHLQNEQTKEKYKKEITEQVQKLEKIIPSFEKNICVANEVENKLIESLEKIKNDIRETAKGLVDEIEAQTKSLIKKVDKRAEAIQKSVEHHREAAEIRVKSSIGINQFAKNLCKHGLNDEIMASAKDLLRRMNELQRDMNLYESGELRFIAQKGFKLGTVEEYKEREENILKAYAEEEMMVNQCVKRGPNWPASDRRSGYESGYYYGRREQILRFPGATIKVRSIQRNRPNDIRVTVSVDAASLRHGQHENIDIECKMNPEAYWLQPSKSYGNYMGRLEYYAKKCMKVGDEVKRGIHWPDVNDMYDDKGQKSGKITQINVNGGNATATVEFGPAKHHHSPMSLECPMYPGCYYLLPLRSFPFINWVEF